MTVATDWASVIVRPLNTVLASVLRFGGAIHAAGMVGFASRLSRASVLKWATMIREAATRAIAGAIAVAMAAIVGCRGAGAGGPVHPGGG
jgi:hypothetical protein